jgi:hypothetical protein
VHTRSIRSDTELCRAVPHTPVCILQCLPTPRRVKLEPKTFITATRLPIGRLQSITLMDTLSPVGKFVSQLHLPAVRSVPACIINPVRQCPKIRHGMETFLLSHHLNYLLLPLLSPTIFQDILVPLLRRNTTRPHRIQNKIQMHTQIPGLGRQTYLTSRRQSCDEILTINQLERLSLRGRAHRNNLRLQTRASLQVICNTEILILCNRLVNLPLSISIRRLPPSHTTSSNNLHKAHRFQHTRRLQLRHMERILAEMFPRLVRLHLRCIINKLRQPNRRLRKV